MMRLACSLALGCVLVALPAHAETGGHAAPEAHGDVAAQAHGDSHAEHALPPFNFAEGLLGVNDDAPPGLLYRRSGTPMPFLANLINAALLFGIIYVVGKKPIAEALKKRKERIVQGMEEAGKMKAEAAATLAEYEEKLKKLDEEVTRIKREMREAAEAERKRILAETRERRERMERDAKLLVEQELKAAREALMRETVAGAVRSAEEILLKQLGTTDHDRLAREYLEGLQKVPLNAPGGRT